MTMLLFRLYAVQSACLEWTSRKNNEINLTLLQIPTVINFCKLIECMAWMYHSLCFFFVTHSCLWLTTIDSNIPKTIP